MEQERRYSIPSALAVAIILIAVALLSRAGFLIPHPKLPAPPGVETQKASVLGSAMGTATSTKVVVSEDDDAVLGDVASPVSIIEFSDVQCPLCKTFFQEVQPKLFDEFIRTGKAHLVTRDYPMYGEASVRAAEAAECAGAQGSYWAYLEGVFRGIGEHPESVLTSLGLTKIARDIEIDMSQFGECVVNRTYKKEVERDKEDAARAGITETPILIINKKLFSGNMSWDELKRYIEEALIISGH